MGYAMRDLSKTTMICRQNRKRGISLLEAILYLTVSTSVIVMFADLMNTESKRQEDISMAQSMNMMINSSQRYVAAEYDAIRDELLSRADLGETASLSVPMQELSSMGYLPDSFISNGENLFGQQYVLLMRAVSALDTSVPQATMLLEDIDADNDNRIDNHLVDQDNSNDEMTIEALLVTSGGEEVPAARGPAIAVRTQKLTAGFVSEEGISRGSYGSFTFDISGFSDFSDYPTPGHFANIISLSRFSTVDFTATNTGQSVPDPMQRCSEIIENPGMTVTSPDYLACLSTNDMYNDIVFNSYDTDGDGIDDIYPGISGANNINMSGSQDTDGDGLPDRFAKISDVYNIEMGSPVDTNGDGTADRYSSITNLARIACGGASDTVIDGTLVIDCENVVANGDMIISGDLITGGDVTGDRFISADMGDQDLSEGIYNTLLLASGSTIPKPICPAVTADGNFQMEPRIFVVPAAYSHPGGLPTVGVRAYTEDANTNDWRVRLYNFVDEDRCTSSISDPLTTNTSDYRAENASKCTSADGLSDVYEVSENAGRVLAMTRCY
jgi:hypothetical protein